MDISTCVYIHKDTQIYLCPRKMLVKTPTLFLFHGWYRLIHPREPGSLSVYQPLTRTRKMDITAQSASTQSTAAFSHTLHCYKTQTHCLDSPGSLLWQVPGRVCPRSWLKISFCAQFCVLSVLNSWISPCALTSLPQEDEIMKFALFV